MAYLDWTSLDEQVEKSLSKYYPNFIFEQVANNLKEVDVVREIKKLKSEKKFLGVTYSKEYEVERFEEKVVFTKELVLISWLYTEEFTIHYGISNKKQTVYWKLVNHTTK